MLMDLGAGRIDRQQGIKIGGADAGSHFDRDKHVPIGSVG